MKGLASARGNRPGRPSGALGLGGCPRPKRASWGFLAAFVAGALMMAGPAWADSGILPDPEITPGAVRTTDASDICSHGTRELRHWDRARDDRIMQSYSLPAGPHPQYEVDHLIPLCLGGADADANLWPEPRRTIEPVFNAEAKDRLEEKMCRMACGDELDILTAQREIAEDWTQAYRRYVKGGGAP